MPKGVRVQVPPRAPFLAARKTGGHFFGVELPWIFIALATALSAPYFLLAHALFHGPEQAADWPMFQWALMPILFMAFGLGFVLLRAKPQKHGWELPLLLAWALACLLLPLQDRMIYGAFERSGFLAAGWIFAMPLLAYAMARRWQLEPSKALWAAALGALLLIQIYQLRRYPLGSYSDMLLLIRATWVDAWAGKAVYAAHPVLAYDLPTTYLPLTWLVYGPSVFLNIDLRWTQLLLWTLFAALAWRLGQRQGHQTLGPLLALALCPWVLFRHEIYLAWYLLSILAMALLYAQGREIKAAFFFGLGLVSSQFAWVLGPLWVLWRWRRQGTKAALQQLGLALAVAFLVLGPFVLPDPKPFWDSVIGFWAHKIELSTFNVLGLMPGLRPWLPGLQTLVLGIALVWFAMGQPSLRRFYMAAGLSVGLMAMSLHHVSHYFYFIALLWLGLGAGLPRQEGNA